MAQEEFDLSGKVAVVTGGSRGLGRAMVLGFARHGADVVIASRKLQSCEALAKEVERDTGRRALAVACHVGRWADCDALFEKTSCLAKPSRSSARVRSSASNAPSAFPSLGPRISRSPRPISSST